ncbi:MAG: hypothetical protein ACFCD0_22185 [Gemmataceae bacterium]
MFKTCAFVGSMLFLGLMTCSLVGCSSQTSENKPEQPKKTAAISNTHCPIMGGEVDSEVKTTWNEKTVGFCCDVCIPKWNDLSEEAKAKKLANPPKDEMSTGEGG